MNSKSKVKRNKIKNPRKAQEEERINPNECVLLPKIEPLVSLKNLEFIGFKKWAFKRAKIVKMANFHKAQRPSLRRRLIRQGEGSFASKNNSFLLCLALIHQGEGTFSLAKAFVATNNGFVVANTF